jgi:hypothetical protein
MGEPSTSDSVEVDGSPIPLSPIMFEAKHNRGYQGR